MTYHLLLVSFVATLPTSKWSADLQVLHRRFHSRISFKRSRKSENVIVQLLVISVAHYDTLTHEVSRWLVVIHHRKVVNGRICRTWQWFCVANSDFRREVKLLL